MRKMGLLAVVCVLLFSLGGTASPCSTYHSIEFMPLSDVTQYVAHDPIIIVNNTDFQSQAVLEGWPGNGSYNHPYIIEGYRIITDLDCISISDVSVYFKIVDCNLAGDVAETGKGISLWNVQNAHIENCSLSWKEFGIDASYGGNLTAPNNDIHDMSEAGIQTDYVDECIITDNVIYNCGHGIDMSYGLCYVVTSNTIHGCSNDAVFLTSAENCILNGNAILNNYQSGVSITDIDLGTITENSLINNGLGGNSQYAKGLYIRYSQFITIESNNISQNYKEGIDLRHGPNCTIRFNTLDCNGYGILASYSSDSLISLNTITHTESLGMMVDTSNDVVVRNNIILCSGIQEDSRGSGLLLVYSQECMVYGNKLYDNSDYGIELEDCSSCLVYQNEIGWNLGGNSHEWDSHPANLWYNPLWQEGNCWSDYNGTGEYTIGGNEESIDPFPAPLLQVNDAADIIAETFTENVTIAWTVYALHPGTYEIICRHETVASGTWSGNTISFFASNLASGTNNFTILVRDSWGHEVSDSIVIRNPLSPDELLLFQVLVISSAGVLGIGFTIWIFQRKRS
jgi:parallel beta-helix repeat protein